MTHANPLDKYLFDNPILVKHLRSRLRRSNLMPGLLIVGVLCLLIIWFGVMASGFASGVVFSLTVGLQGIILVILGASQVANAVGKVRESNILDFHRISPLPPFEIALGFFLGAPILEYVLWLVPMPLALYAATQGAPGFLNFLQVEVAQLLVAWAFHGLALLTSLMSKKPKANMGGMIALMFIVFGQFAGFAFQGAQVLAQDPTIGFFGVRLPWLAVLAIYVFPVLTFELIAATRKMRSERMHALSKPQALAFLTTATVLLLGGSWGASGVPAAAIVVLYVQVVLGLLSTITITPNANEYAKGLRRAQRAGRRRLPPWDDLALNRIGVMMLSLIVLVGSTLAWNVLGPPPGAGQQDQGGFTLAISIGVLVVAYFGLAVQFFGLLAPKRPGVLIVLFLFLAWLVPMLIAAVLGASGAGEEVFVIPLAVSPIMGIAMASGAAPQNLTQTAQISALLPAVLFFFLFNNLVSVYRRRVERSVESGPTPGKVTVPEPDPLALV